MSSSKSSPIPKTPSANPIVESPSSWGSYSTAESMSIAVGHPTRRMVLGQPKATARKVLFPPVPKDHDPFKGTRIQRNEFSRLPWRPDEVAPGQTMQQVYPPDPRVPVPREADTAPPPLVPALGFRTERLADHHSARCQAFVQAAGERVSQTEFLSKDAESKACELQVIVDRLKHLRKLRYSLAPASKARIEAEKALQLGLQNQREALEDRLKDRMDLLQRLRAEAGEAFIKSADWKPSTRPESATSRVQVPTPQLRLQLPTRRSQWAPTSTPSRPTTAPESSAYLPVDILLKPIPLGSYPEPPPLASPVEEDDGLFYEQTPKPLGVNSRMPQPLEEDGVAENGIGDKTAAPTASADAQSRQLDAQRGLPAGDCDVLIPSEEFMRGLRATPKRGVSREMLDRLRAWRAYWVVTPWGNEGGGMKWLGMAVGLLLIVTLLFLIFIYYS